MKLKIAAFAILTSILAASCQDNSSSIKIENPTNYNAHELLVEIDDSKIIEQANALSEFKLMNGETEIQYEAIRNGEKITKLLTQVNIPANGSTSISIEAGKSIPLVKKTYSEISIAQGGEWKWVTKRNGNQQWEYQGGTSWKNVNELIVDEKHWDHSFDIRYEGPGWESDKIAYRFYLDWRNAVDIFGKKVSTPVLKNVGVSNFDSYHDMSDWGADIMKVGNSLGIGSFGHWAEGKVTRVDSTDNLSTKIEDGDLQAKVITTYSGWEYTGGKTNLVSTLTINAGSYLTKCHLSSSEPINNITTGIYKLPNTDVIKGENGNWCYFGTFGVQSLNKDELGLVVFYNKNNLKELNEDELNYAIILNPEHEKHLTYYFAGMWTLDSSKVKTTEEFKAFADQQVALLNAGLIK